MKEIFSISMLLISTVTFSQVQYKMLEGAQKGQFRLDFTKEPPVQGPVDSVWGSHILMSFYGSRQDFYFDSSGAFLFSMRASNIRNSNDSSVPDSIGWGNYYGPLVWMDVFRSPDAQNSYVLLNDIQMARSLHNYGGLRYRRFDPYANNGNGKVTFDTLILIKPREYRMKPFVTINDPVEKNNYLIYNASPSRGREMPDTFRVLQFKNDEFILTGSEVVLQDRLVYMTTSHNKKMIAATGGGKIYLFDFETKTGKISLNRILDTWPIQNPNPAERIAQPRFCTFSPNDSFLYVTSSPREYAHDKVKRVVYQYNLFSGSTSDYKQLIQEDKSYYGILTGINGKIYLLTHWGNIDVIQYPNKSGKNCRYLESPAKEDSFYRQFDYQFLGPIHNSNFVRFAHKNTCDGVDLYNRSDNLFTSFTWYFEDLQNGTEDSATGNSASFGLTQSGRYYVRLKGQAKSGYIAWYSDTLYMHHPVKPQVSFAPPDTICQHVPVNFFAEANTLLPDSLLKETWQWSFGDGESSAQNPAEKVYKNAGAFSVQLIYSNGFCTDTTEQTVYVNNIIDAECADFKPVLWVPDAFSPGHDDVNDEFSVTAIGIRSLKISIFSRWGELVFESSDADFSWNGTYKGTPAPEGHYLYTIEAQGINNSIIRKRGTILLLRTNK